MKIWMMALGCAALSACVTPAPTEKATLEKSDPDAVQVMIIGAFHMGNPGQDVANAEIENMLTDQRQAEIAAVASAIAEFNPNVVAVERITEAPEYVDPKYNAFKPEMLKEIPDERYQIGYRLANMMNLAQVYGVDEQPSDGEPDYFPFGELMAHADATGQAEVLQQQITEIQAIVGAFAEKQKTHNFAELLLLQNSGSDLKENSEFYYRTFVYDRGEAQPGAELQAYWFMRNAKIFSKLMQVTEPGDRVVVVYGAGHKPWLDHFAGHTPGYVNINPVPYLEKAAAE